MTTRTDPESPGLGALLADTLEWDLPDVELLIRYAEDPASLDPEERSKIEWELARSPIYAAQLRLLHRTDFEALRPVSAEQPSVAPSRGPVRPRRSVWTRWLLVAVPAAAALLLWIAQGSDPTTSSAALAPQPDLERPKVARAEPAAREDAATARSGADAQASDAGANDRVTRSEERTNSATSATQPLAEAAPSSTVTARSNVGVRRSEERTAAPQETPGSSAESRSARDSQDTPAQTTETSSGSRMIDRGNFSASIAMVDRLATEPPTEARLMALQLPHYRAPAGAEPRPPRSSTLRGASGQWGLRALLPAHVAHTGQTSPALFWSLDALPPEGAEIEFAITTPDEIDPLVRRSLPTPRTTGIQRIELDPATDLLPQGTEYRWSLVIRTGSGANLREELVSGWIRRVPISDSLRSDLERASPENVPALLAAAGLWYDALEATLALATRYPNHPRVTQALSELLAQSGR